MHVLCVFIHINYLKVICAHVTFSDLTQRGMEAYGFTYFPDIRNNASWLLTTQLSINISTTNVFECLKLCENTTIVPGCQFFHLDGSICHFNTGGIGRQNISILAVPWAQSWDIYVRNS